MPVPDIDARYVRIMATKLRMMAEEGSSALLGRLALRQIEVIAGGRNVAVGATVTASSSLEEGPWSAAAVADGKEVPDANPRAADTLLLRREFSPRAAVRRAVLFVTGLGSYTLSIDGTPIAPDNLLEPGWTDAARTCLCATHDVTAQLSPGAHTIALTLAGGMYNVKAVPGRCSRSRSSSSNTPTAQRKPSSPTSNGATTFAHIFGSEDHDPRREPRGWDRPGFERRAGEAPSSLQHPAASSRQFLVPSADPGAGDPATVVETPAQARRRHL